MDEAKKVELTEKITQLKSLGVTSELNYKEIMDILNKNVPLRNWYVAKKHSLEIGSLSDEEVSLYKENEVNFCVDLLFWNDWVEMMRTYLITNNTDSVPSGIKIDKVYALGAWFKRHRAHYKELNDEQKAILNDVSPIFTDVQTKDTSVHSKQKSKPKNTKLQKLSEKKIQQKSQQPETEHKYKPRKKQDEPEIAPVIISWDEYFEQLRSYKEQTGRVTMRATYVTEDGVPLGKWIVEQRNRLTKGTIPYVEYTKLKDLGVDFGDRYFHYLWIYSVEEGIALLQEYIAANGISSLDQASITPIGHTLGRWYYHIVSEMEQGKIPYNQIKQFQTLGLEDAYCRRFKFDTLEKTWQNYYELAKSYIIDKTGLSVDQKGYETETKLVDNWIKAQRKMRYELPKRKRELLETIVGYWDKTEQRNQQEHAYIQERIQEILNKYEDGVISITVHGLKLDSLTGKIVPNPEESDYFECEILLSGFLGEEEIKEYVRRNINYLIKDAIKQVVTEYGECQRFTARELHVDKVRCGTKSKILSIMMSLKLKM